MNNIEILRTAGCSPDVVAHCVRVSKTALAIADCVKFPVDSGLIGMGGLYHDIGRSRSHGIDHALAGVEIGKRLGFSDGLINIIERHIGAGISAMEVEWLGLPKKDYLPLTFEEKIVSYADNLINGVREMPFYEALDRFKEILGPDHEGVGLFIKQHYEILEWLR